MYAFLMTLFVLVAILMVVVILLQSSKGGLAGTFGGAGGGPGGVLGSRGAASFLQKATIALGLIFSLLCIAINLVGGAGEGVQRSVTQEELNQQAPTQLPSPTLPQSAPPATPTPDNDGN